MQEMLYGASENNLHVVAARVAPAGFDIAVIDAQNADGFLQGFAPPQRFTLVDNILDGLLEFQNQESFDG